VKRIILVAVVVVLTVSFAVQGALALSTISVAADTWVHAGDSTNHNTQGLGVTSGGINGACNPSDTAFLRWDLSGVTAANVGSATVTLTDFQNTGFSTNPVELTLYAVADNTWNEANLGGDTAGTFPPPPIGNALATATAPVSPSNSPLVFQSQLLTDYVKGKAGTAASFAVQMTTCGGATSPNVLLYDKENGSSTTDPYMTITPTTAVQVSTFRTADPAVNWPLIVGLGVLALVVIGGLAVSRRRAAAR
jgi:hypothetical protein